MKNKYYALIILIIITLGFNITTLFVTENLGNDSIKVMTYNVHQFYVQNQDTASRMTGEYTFNKLLDLIKSENPDIIALQESEGSRLSSGNQNGVFWLASKLRMHYYYGPSTAEQIYGVSFLSKWPIKTSEWVQMPNEESIERVIINAVIDSPFGEISVYNTHFQTSSYKLDQRNQANFLLDYVVNDRAIIFGDFNTASTTNGEAYHLLNSTFTYAWIEDGNHPNATNGFTSPAADPRNKIDFIWLTPNDWMVITGSVRVIGDETMSDHKAVVAELTPN